MNIDFEGNERMDRAMDRTREIIGEMTYTAYYHERRLNPAVPLSEWARTFPDVEQLEERYQTDLHFKQKGFNYGL